MIRPMQPTVNELFNKKLKATKLFYGILQEDAAKGTSHACKDKWSNIIPPEFLNEVWKKVFCLF